MTLKSKPQPRIGQQHDSIFFELTRSICPECKTVIDAQIILRDGKVFMRKRCKDHGWFESLLSSDAEMYIDALKFNRPGTIPLRYTTEVKDGCPLDCGLCTEHKQHTCLAIIDVNTACNLDCPICFADAGPGYNLTMDQVGTMLDAFVEMEGEPEVVQFSGGEPTIHPQILDMVILAREKGIKQVMINTNGVRIARDDRFFEKMARVKPYIYLQFDGLEPETYKSIRGEDLVETKLKALDRLAEADMDVVLVAAIDRGVNEHEVGALVKFGLKHPAVRGVIFQPVFHTGRHLPFDPLDRVTMPDIVKGIAAQTDGMFRVDDFVPVPCCYPNCQMMTYAYVDGDEVTPLPRVLNVNDYLDYISNSAFPDLSIDVKKALEGLWSATSIPGSQDTADKFECAVCDIPIEFDLGHLKKHVFAVIIKSFMDAYTLDVKQLMKCCVGQLVPDGRMIPFCAYNNVGYREQIREELNPLARRRSHNGSPLPSLPSGGLKLSSSPAGKE